MISPNEYQGFTGSNYDEDDAERAKQGGFVHFSGSNNVPNIRALQQIANNPSIITDTPKAKAFKRLDETRDNIMSTQAALDQMDPQSPNYHSLQQLLNAYQQTYMSHPLHDEHFQGVLERIQNQGE